MLSNNPAVLLFAVVIFMTIYYVVYVKKHSFIDNAKNIISMATQFSALMVFIYMIVYMLFVIDIKIPLTDVSLSPLLSAQAIILVLNIVNIMKKLDEQ